MTIVTIASSKGGSGKTSAATTIAAKLAANDATLLIDLDTQGQCSLFLGLEGGSGVYEWLVRRQPLPSCLHRVPDDLLVMPGDSRTKLVDAQYREQPSGFDDLVRELRTLPYRWIVLDTAPSGFLQEAALAAADHVVIPFIPETSGVDGVYGTLALVQRLAPDAEVTLLPMAVDRRLAEHRQRLLEMGFEFGKQVTDHIPVRSAVKQAIRDGVSIWAFKHRRLADVRAAYSKLVDRIMAAAAL